MPWSHRLPAKADWRLPGSNEKSHIQSLDRSQLDLLTKADLLRGARRDDTYVCDRLLAMDCRVQLDRVICVCMSQVTLCMSQVTQSVWRYMFGAVVLPGLS